MTDHDPLDDLASAHLDGTTTPEEAARVDADPELLARVEALRGVRAAVAAPVPVDPDRREAAIAAALAAYDDAGLATGPVAPVRSLTPVTERRPGAARSWRLVGVAAAVAALVALVPLVASLSSDSDRDDMASESAALGDSAERDQGGVADSTVPDAEAFDPTSSTITDRPVVALGAFDDDDALVAAARSTMSSTTGAYAIPTPPAAGCLDDLLADLPADVPVLLTATARLGDAPVDVVVTRDEVRIVGGDCTDVLIRPR